MSNRIVGTLAAWVLKGLCLGVGLIAAWRICHAFNIV